MAPIYNVDRAVGTAATIFGVVVVGCVVHHLIWRSRSNADKKKAKSTEDNYYRTRYHAAERRENHLWHQGSCQCMMVQFNIFAPSVLHAVDVPSKLRFPRLSMAVEDFQLLCDDSHLSLYTMESSDGVCIGGYSFCRFCGMQVLYTPLSQPGEVQVNMDCLNTETVSEVHIAYHSAATDPLPAEPARYMYGESQRFSPVSISNLTTPNEGSFRSSKQFRREAFDQYPAANLSNDLADAQSSESTEDIYQENKHFSTPHGPVGSSSGGGYKYAIDDSDTMSLQSFEQDLQLPAGKVHRLSDCSFESYSSSSFSQYGQQSPHRIGAEAAVDIAQYSKLKKYLQRHV